MKKGVLSNFARSHISSDRVRSGYEIKACSDHSVKCFGWKTSAVARSSSSFKLRKSSRWSSSFTKFPTGFQIPAASNEQLVFQLLAACFTTEQSTVKASSFVNYIHDSRCYFYSRSTFKYAFKMLCRFTNFIFIHTRTRPFCLYGEGHIFVYSRFKFIRPSKTLTNREFIQEYSYSFKNFCASKFSVLEVCTFLENNTISE